MLPFHAAEHRPVVASQDPKRQTQRVIPDERTQRLIALERESFHRYCAMLRSDPAEMEARLMPETRRTIEARIVERVSVYGPEEGERFRVRWSAVIEGKDYVTLNHALTEEEKLSHVRFLAGAAAQLPIHIPYLNALATRLETPPVALENPSSIDALLRAVPVIHYYELNFNAFVDGESVVDGIPAVCVFGHLFGSLEQLIDVTSPLLVDDQRQLAMPDPLTSRAHETPYVHTCIQVLETILCESGGVEESGVERLTHGPLGYHQLDFMMGGAWSFLWLHEYAHLLRGHLLGEPTSDVELDADAFAARAVDLRAAKWSDAARQGGVVGVIYFFVALHVIECVRGRSPSAVHPPALMRLQRISNNGAWVAAVADRIRLACAPAVLARWDVHL